MALQANHRRHTLLKHDHSGETWTGSLTLANLTVTGTSTLGGVVTTGTDIVVGGLDITRNSQTSGLRLWGGNAASQGAGFQLFGPNHATGPSYAYLDAAAHNFRTTAGVQLAYFDATNIYFGTPTNEFASAPNIAYARAGQANLAIRNTTDNVETYLGSGGGSGWVGTMTAHDFTIYVGNVARLLFGSGGGINFSTVTDPVYNLGIKVSGHNPAASTGAGAELLYSGGVGYYQCYDRTNATYVTSYVTGATINIYGVSGGVVFNGYGAGTLTTDASGNITAVSDRRMKTNIRPFNRSLNAVRALEPVIYKYNEESGLDQVDDYVGFVAQDVRSAVPEAVSVTRPVKVPDGFPGRLPPDRKAGLMTLSDRPIIAALVNAVKELADRVETLEA
jgi:hypothetical protein